MSIRISGQLIQDCGCQVELFTENYKYYSDYSYLQPEILTKFGTFCGNLCWVIGGIERMQFGNNLVTA